MVKHNIVKRKKAYKGGLLCADPTSNENKYAFTI